MIEGGCLLLLFRLQPSRQVAHVILAISSDSGRVGLLNRWPKWPPAVESSLVVEDKDEIRGLYRDLVSRVLFTSYRCILNYYPINSKTILWGNSDITPQGN